MSFDPYDMEVKKSIHPLADELNYVRVCQGVPKLFCGAGRRENPCRSLAGARTDHFGYGRCYRHGGLSTGPVTEEGKAASTQNNRQHGFYSAALAPAEREAYERLMGEKKLSVIDEINMLKAKILVYLEKWRRKAQEKGEDATQVAYRMVTDGDDGERISEIAGYYHAGSIEDRPLLRALQELSRLVDKQAKLSTNDGEDLLAQINAELRAASHGKVTLAWSNRKPQERQNKNG